MQGGKGGKRNIMGKEETKRRRRDGFRDTGIEYKRKERVKEDRVGVILKRKERRR